MESTHKSTITPISDSNRWVFDVEVYRNLFTLALINYDDNNRKLFEISERKNEYQLLIDFLKTKPLLMGFNNENYDNTILNTLLKKYKDFKEKDYFTTTSFLKTISDSIIEENYDVYKIFKWNFPLKYIDIFLYWSRMLRISKKLSLKSIAVNINWPRIQELPLDPMENVSIDLIDSIIDYNFNDVEITQELFNRMKDQINLRINIHKTYGIECLNKDAIKIASDILAKSYSEKTGIPIQDFKDWRTIRESIAIEDVILDKFEFEETPTKISYDNSSKRVICNSPYTLLQELKKRVVTTTTELNYSVIQDNIDGVLKSDYGSGGIHSMADVTIVKTTDTHKLITSDVASLYPTAIIENEFIPEHLGKQFLEVYRDIKTQRIQAKREGNKVVNETLKLCLNGSYGLFNNDYSWLKDSAAVLKVTLFGQLLITTLAESCIKNNIKVISCNTDGLEVLCPNDLEELYFRLVKEVEDKFLVEFEHDYYKKIVYNNINNYIAITTSDKIKEKGLFLTDPPLDMSRDYLVIPKALREYFVNNIPVETFIKNHNNIYDFTCAQKCDKKFEVYWRGEKQQRLNRYYVSKKGAYLYKSKDQGNTMNHMMKGWPVELFNDYVEKNMGDYQIDYRYYISKAREIINQLEPKQLNLFDNI